MTCYYNEHDPFAAQWLRELMADGLIAPGFVDERSIDDVTPSELAGYRQCHFFAGIGVWSLALRLAGWPDDKPIWTGSCPCQPFSAAGKGGGFADERHLWPAFFHLIEQCRPAVVVGEQVASKDGLAWLDLIQADLEGAGYTNGALDTCAAGFGAPHIRQRLYWMGHAIGAGQQGRERSGNVELHGGTRPLRSVTATGTHGGMEHAARIGRREGRPESAGQQGRSADSGSSSDGGMADARHAERRPQRIDGKDGRDGPHGGRTEAHGIAGTRGEVCGMADAEYTERRSEFEGDRDASRRDGFRGRGADGGMAYSGLERESAVGEIRRWTGAEPARGGNRPGPTNGLWRNADWLGCRDGKWRPVESGTFPLAPTGTVRNRVGTLRGAGNALNVAQAQGFVEAVMSL